MLHVVGKYKAVLVIILLLVLRAILISPFGFDQNRLNAGGYTETAVVITTVNPTPYSSVPTIDSQRNIVTETPGFDGGIAYKHVASQLEFGPRTPGSQAHDRIVSWLMDELTVVGGDVVVQQVPHENYLIKNVIAKFGKGQPWIILGAHYDTRIYADRDPDPDKRSQPVPGANDGASGVAVLLELARVLPSEFDGEIWFVFFDAEDNGDISGWDWILGSQAFVSALQGQPDAAVIVDMIGDESQQIFWEKSSDPVLRDEIWQVSADLGYSDRFIARPGYRIIDDHTPFLQAGIPAIDIIDFDYPYWHTTDDTIDKVSVQSLQVVGDVISHWLMAKLSIEPDS